MKVIDKKVFMDTFQYFDKPIVVEIIDIFINEYPERMNTLRRDIETLDFNSLKFDAHSLKGVVSNFVAPDPQNLAKILELKGSEKDSTELLETFSALEKATADLVEDLKTIREDFLQ
jgi:HPt (histidine-containing phosphotransfer) domain-containing protein